MTVVEIAVVILGVGLIVGELWFFLGPRAPVASQPRTADGLQEIKVLVKGGYDPDVIPVEVGRPVRLLFYRDETAERSARLVFNDFGIDKELPSFKTTVVEFTPERAGDYTFHCGSPVMTGRVVAQVGRDGARANLGKGHGKHG